MLDLGVVADTGQSSGLEKGDEDITGEGKAGDFQDYEAGAQGEDSNEPDNREQSECNGANHGDHMAVDHNDGPKTPEPSTVPKEPGGRLSRSASRKSFAGRNQTGVADVTDAENGQKARVNGTGTDGG